MTQRFEEALTIWFANADNVSSVELRDQHRKMFPLCSATATDASIFLKNLTSEGFLQVDDSGGYNVYRLKAKPITVEIIKNEASSMRTSFTKKQLKARLKAKGFAIDSFKSLFSLCDFRETGAVNTEGHKFYISVGYAGHYSKTSKKEVKIKDMPKPYLKNTLKKSYGRVTVTELLESDENSELHKLVKAFFTYELRNL